MSAFYFYVLDDEFGPGFIKLCTYFPYPGKVWLNGYEWPSVMLIGPASTTRPCRTGSRPVRIDPRRLQSICDRLNDAHLQLFFERWMRVIPTPLGAADRAAGYWWELSMRQIEVSRTIVFGIHNLAELVVKAKAANDRPARHPARRPGLCHRDRSLEADLTASLQEDQRTGAIPSGDPRAMAWPVHSAWTLNSVAGFTNKSLRALVPQLLDASYNYKQTQMTFDLRRRRLKGLITRVECTNTCTLTPEGQHFAITYTKLGARVLPLLLDADKPPAPAELRHALKTIDRHVNDYLNARGTRGITVCSRRAALPTPRPAALGRSDIIGDRLRAPIPPCSSSNGL